ncbi:MAG: HEPN domain-containing protein [Betaproteobacteria bacterium]|nr:HEPN domain-containing protein [Betaproteobacteria bacterium]
MTPPTPLREEALRLLRLARRDRDTFELLLPLPKASLAAIGFHAQQAVEKALKAVAVLSGVAISRTHDLAALGQAMVDRGRELPLSVDQLRSLNPFAVQFRYDDELVPDTTREALDSMVSAVLDWAGDVISRA